jgi:acyl-CoA reductase-like NAD-dependent aldehyde dehydrogenase
MAVSSTVLGDQRPVVSGSPYFADLNEHPPETHRPDIDEVLGRLQANKDSWVRLGMHERLSLLDEVRRDFISLSDRWVAAELEAKRIAPQTLGEAEEWAMLATVHRALRTLRQSLAEIEELGQPKVPGPIALRPDGQVVAQTFPLSVWDRFLFLGTKGEVWMEPGVGIDETVATQAAAYKDANRKGKVCLVLGAGNASMLPVTDALDKLFVELQVVVLKPNPVNAHLGPLIEEGFRALIERGFLAVVYGGAEEGAYLSSHPDVEELHLTGSDKTFEAVAFGTGSEGAKRKTERRPLIAKRFTGELGNVSPVIVVPGPWTQRDIDEQAKHIATWLGINAGFNCLTPRVLIQHSSWPQRNPLMDAVGGLLERVPLRYPYYPGARDRHAEYLEAHPQARLFGTAEPDRLPWAVIPDVNPEDTNDICFRREAFCGLFAETALDAPSTVSFIERAVEFANQTLWGTLCATIIVHPKSLRDPSIAAAVDQAMSDLQYGTVSLNMLVYFSAYFMGSPWGGIPGHDIYDIQSGIGKTTNMLMFDRPQKSILRAPFRRLDPLTIKSKRAAEFGQKLAAFEASPSWSKFPSLVWTALRA